MEPAQHGWPQLLSGTELIGPAAGSGLRQAPYLVRRRDGQVVQLSRLLFALAGCMTGEGVDVVADRAGAMLDLRITPSQVAYVAETTGGEWSALALAVVEELCSEAPCSPS